jgi:membrane carboxypeptidase/penicillin-binding protein
VKSARRPGRWRRLHLCGRQDRHHRDENDAWFVGCTNQILVAVWVGYDNAGYSHRTLDDDATGASVAVPIFQSNVETAGATA